MINGIHLGTSYGVTDASKSAVRTQSEKPAKTSQPEQINRIDTIETGTKQEASVAYTRVTNKKLGASEIASLKAQADAAAENLRKLVEELILKQSKNYKASAEDSSQTVSIGSGVTASDIEAAKNAISEDGEFGVKAVSDRLVNFAISISGGDKSKLSKLVSAIDKGFAAARDALGGELPDICRKTYDETMRKLNLWANESKKDG